MSHKKRKLRDVCNISKLILTLDLQKMTCIILKQPHLKSLGYHYKTVSRAT